MFNVKFWDGLNYNTFVTNTRILRVSQGYCAQIIYASPCLQ